ncbi:MAG: hypothetical protein F6K31_07880 [Symploca sp. SIO2G7]|nr:hypothetical protein [Symploca sp. SIO2G7]
MNQTFLAQFSLSDVLSAGEFTSNEVIEAFNQIWTDLLLSPGIYPSIVKLGLLIALGSMAIFLVQWGKEMMEGKLVDFDKVIWVVVVIMLLNNDGRLLAETTLGLRAVINETNQMVLSQTANDVTLREAYKQAAVQKSSAEVLAIIKEQCRTQATPEAQQKCLEQKERQFEEYIRRVQEINGSENSSYWERFTAYLRQEIETVSSGALASFIRPAIVGVLALLFGAFSSAFQWLLEVALILQAMIAPIAVGASILPTSSKPIISWVSGFFALGMAKLGFNLVAGLVATVDITAGESLSSLVLPVFLGLFAPVLALVVAGGSGFAMFVALSSVSSGLTSLVVTKVTTYFARGSKSVAPKK